MNLNKIYSEPIPVFETNDQFYKWRLQYLKPILLPVSGVEEYFEDELIEQLVSFELDPLATVLFLWDWGNGLLENRRLEQWQIDTFVIIRDHLQNNATRYKPLKIAISTGHGTGKSAFMSMFQIAMLSNLAFTRVNELANTGQQLAGKTWPEIQKWLDLSLVRDWFDFNAKSLSIRGDAAKRWRSDAVTWSLNNLAAVAGLHNHMVRVIVLFDEASEIPQKIFEVYEGAMTDKDTQIIWLAFGNPTLNSGAFYDLFFSNKSDWKTRHIDSRTVTLTNKEYLSECVDRYGEDSDFVRVRIRGLPPRTAINQCIPQEWIDVSRKRIFKFRNEWDYAPCIVGIDGAWTGDDTLEVYVRQGPFAKHILTIEKNDNDIVTMSRIVQAVADQHPDDEVDAWILDQGQGTGLYSAGLNLELKNIHLVPFGGASPVLGYANMRTYIWRTMGEWCRDIGSIYNDQALELELGTPQLHQITTGNRTGWWILESKKDMLSRGVKSPNRGDALAVTFALPVKKRKPIGAVASHHTNMSYRKEQNRSEIFNAFRGLV